MCLKLPERQQQQQHDDVVPEMEPPPTSDVPCAHCGGCCSSVSLPTKKALSFVEQMLALRVESKPRVEPLGTTAAMTSTTTPGGPKFARRSNSMPIEVTDSFESSSGNSCSSPRGGGGGGPLSKKKIVKKGPPYGKPARRKSNAASPVPPASRDVATNNNHAVKVAKMSKRWLSTNDLLDSNGYSRKRQRVEAKPAPIPPVRPPEGRSLSYVEKQYHSVWLAVPPAAAETSHPPRPPPKSRIGRSSDALTTPTTTDTILVAPSASKSRTLAKPTTAQLVRSAKSTASRTKKPRSGGGSQLNTVSKAESGRIYHSVRGADGKFVRVYIDDPMAQERPPPAAAKKATFAARSTPAAAKKRSPPSFVETKRSSAEPDDDADSPERPSMIATVTRGKPAPIDKKTLKKQKVKSYPRNRVHYYNRVVKAKRGSGSRSDEFFFVMEYDETKDVLCIVPMVASGTLAGKREGRPRYQCEIGDTDENFRIVSAADYEVVRSAMVMKTPILAAEAWDIEKSNDVDFLTR
jgi:hypothetical protein